MNRHEEIKELIAIYDSLNRAERAGVDQHLLTCLNCRTQLAAYQRMDDSLELLVDPEPTENLRADFYARLDAKWTNQSSLWRAFPPFFKQLSGHLAQAGALAVIAILIFSMWLALRSQTEQPAAVPSLPAAIPQPTSTPTSSPNPEQIVTTAPTTTPTPTSPAWAFQQLTSLSGQLNVVRAVTIGENGRYIAATGSNSNTTIWQQAGSIYQYQQFIQKEVASGALLNGLDFSASEYLAVGGTDSEDGLVSVRYLPNGDEAYALPSPIPPVEAVAFSNNGSILVIGTQPAPGEQNGSVYLWFLNYSDRLYELPFEGQQINDLAFSPDDSLVAAVFDSGVTLWQVTSNEHLQTLSAESGQSPTFSSLAFSPDSQTIAAGTQDGSVYIWQLSTGELIHHFDTGSTTIQSLAFSANSQQLATVSNSGMVTIWQLEDDKPQQLFTGETAERVRLATDILFVNDTVLVAVGLTNGQIQLWQAAPNVID